MYLLFKDPKGKNAAVIHSQGDSKLSGFSSFQIQNNKCVELEKKVTLLEYAMQEKEKTICTLRRMIDTSNSHSLSPTQVWLAIVYCMSCLLPHRISGCSNPCMTYQHFMKCIKLNFMIQGHKLYVWKDQ